MDEWPKSRLSLLLPQPVKDTTVQQTVAPIGPRRAVVFPTAAGQKEHSAHNRMLNITTHGDVSSGWQLHVKLAGFRFSRDP
jgi:hypothetical protein